VNLGRLADAAALLEAGLDARVTLKVGDGLALDVHRFYLRRWIPAVGRLLSGHAREYAYLPASIAQVPQGEAILALLRDAGFTECRCERYTFGICSCYTGTAPQ
jgi:demethylmenaquinone methyltransferase/2-methoxy-6-polyprenyl-1,4-benzoquinol methylase